MEIYRNFTLFLLLSFLKFACSQDLLSCLSSGGVANVTTYCSPSYPQLLNTSTKNLRFTRSNVSKPFTIIFPTNQSQVSTAIRCAREGSWTIRVRCGGHSYEGLSSTANTPFVIIDMTNLNRITVNLKSETAWVEGGATVGQIYYAIGKSSKKYGFSAGICPTVGSGGHLSGGGYGALVRKYGLGADNVVDAILIDAAGRTLDRAAMGEEIFWAIRGGGGGSWGVIAAWKIRLLPVPKTVTACRAMRVGTVSQAANLWYKWQMVAPKLEDEFFLSFVAVPRNDTIGIGQTFLGLFLGPRTKALKNIGKAFPELNFTTQECKEMTWVESVVYLWGAADVPTVDDLKNRSTFPKSFSKVKYDYVKVPIPLDVMNSIMDMVSKQNKSSILLDPYGGAVNRIRSDAIAFPHRGNLYAIEYFIDWQAVDDGNNDEYLEWIRRLYKFMEPYVSMGPRAVYVNNLDLDLGVIDWRVPGLSGPLAVELARAWGQKYFLGNYERLVRAKTVVDPFNVFKNPQSIPPLTLAGIAGVESELDDVL
ncbi:berberine bridge enzyme-like D-1 [Magnolia sinica]|uniref:berberine bridge enzyme-like D-1 n=1 Tax=Magnolia sinica TaxID=86752 RepID=UPI002658CAB8|nr:berberine bridge enzyme-like D-1 [Magnolia sinica]